MCLGQEDCLKTKIYNTQCDAVSAGIPLNRQAREKAVFFTCSSHTFAIPFDEKTGLWTASPVYFLQENESEKGK